LLSWWPVTMKTLSDLPLRSTHLVCQYSEIWTLSQFYGIVCERNFVLQDEGDRNLTRRQSYLFWTAAWDVWLHHISSWWVYLLSYWNGAMAATLILVNCFKLWGSYV
jgi:hypothetical protein